MWYTQHSELKKQRRLCMPELNTSRCGELCLPIKPELIARAVPNILFVFYLGQIVGRIVYLYSAE